MKIEKYSKKEILDKLKLYFQDPKDPIFDIGKDYIVILWKVSRPHGGYTGHILNTQHISDMQKLYYILTSDLEIEYIAGIDPEDLAFILEFLNS